jgi:hypothetical protein
MFHRPAVVLLMIFSTAHAQSTSARRTAPVVVGPAPIRPLSAHEKFRRFVQETASPLTVAASAFNAGFAQIANTDPRYGDGRIAFAQRFGAGFADIASQNFFGDYVAASALHEDPRYFRVGPEHGWLFRAAYALSRAAVVRTDSGAASFNWSNFIGSAASAGLANAYYPPVSRTSGAMALHFAGSYAGSGLMNLIPEFWPDIRRRLFHWP